MPAACLLQPKDRHTRELGAEDEVFGAQASEIIAEPRMFVFRYRSPQHWLDVFKTFYGPMLKAFAALDAKRRRR